MSGRGEGTWVGASGDALTRSGVAVLQVFITNYYYEYLLLVLPYYMYLHCNIFIYIRPKYLVHTQVRACRLARRYIAQKEPRVEL